MFDLDTLIWDSDLSSLCTKLCVKWKILWVQAKSFVHYLEKKSNLNSQ